MSATNEKKIALIHDVSRSDYDDEDFEKYLKALQSDDKKTINEMEFFGENPRKIFMNMRYFRRSKLFGFNEFSKDEHGWFQRPKFPFEEQIVILSKNSNSNVITIKKSPNDKWTYGIHYSTGNGGGDYGADIWGKVIDTREVCINMALEEMKERHLKAKENAEKYGDSCKNYNSKVSEPVVKAINEMLNIKQQIKQEVQLDLFNNN